MLDFQAIRLLHRHGNGEYAAMAERPEQDPAARDPERGWVRGSRIFACADCADEVVVMPTEPMKGEAASHSS